MEDKTREYDKCLRCGRKLINPEYRKRGYGKVCYEKVIVNRRMRVLFTVCGCKK